MYTLTSCAPQGHPNLLIPDIIVVFLTRRKRKENKKMAELTQGEVVYSPRTVQVWRALLNWLGFFFQIFLQILRALGHLPLLSSSTSSSSSASFKPLPVIELPDQELPAESAVQIAAVNDSVSDSDDCTDKLTVPSQ